MVEQINETLAVTKKMALVCVCLASEIPSTQSNFCQGNITLETERERENEQKLGSNRMEERENQKE